MRLLVSTIDTHGRTVTVIISIAPNSGNVIVTASMGRLQVRLSVTHRDSKHSTFTFAAKLSSGRWTLTVTGTPAKGYAAPAAERYYVAIPG